MKKTTVVIGLSGGVDSSVAAKILLDQGFSVIGVFLKTWDDTDPQCPAAEDSIDARSVAQKLAIPFYTVDLIKEYRDNVFSYFVEQNQKGRTPNPDILCNKYIKFDAFLRTAKELGADYIATGHYAKKQWNEKTQKWELALPKDANKDQSYFLYTLNQHQLSKVLFPLHDLTKPQIREQATNEGFITADKKDSVGICMVGDRNYREFLEEFLQKEPGEMRELDTQQIVGQHTGLSFYTIGQRRDLGIGGVRGFPEAPWFVIKKDFENNTLLVSQNESHLEQNALHADHLHWVAGNPPAKKFSCEAKIRYRSDSVTCDVEIDEKNSLATVHFMKPVRAIAPGQSIVFYDGSVLFGGGEIL